MKQLRFFPLHFFLPDRDAEFGENRLIFRPTKYGVDSVLGVIWNWWMMLQQKWWVRSACEVVNPDDMQRYVYEKIHVLISDTCDILVTWHDYHAQTNWIPGGRETSADRSATKMKLWRKRRTNRNRERGRDAPRLKEKNPVPPWCLPFFLDPSAFRPFGASAKFLLQAPPKACATAQQPNGARNVSQSLEARQSFGICWLAATFFAMPGGPSFKFNFDRARALLPRKREAGSGSLWNVSLTSYLNESTAVWLGWSRKMSGKRITSSGTTRGRLILASSLNLRGKGVLLCISLDAFPPSHSPLLYIGGVVWWEQTNIFCLMSLFDAMRMPVPHRS